MKRTNNAQGIKTKEKVINSAIKLMASKGAHNVNIQDIADDCKLERSLIVYYFKDKNMIFAEAWDYVYQRAITSTEERLLASGSASEKLTNYFSISVEFFTKNRDITVLYFQLHYMSVFDDKLRQLNTNIKKRAINRIAKIIMDGQRKKEYKQNIDPYLNAKVIHSSLVGLIINSITEFEDFPLNEITNEFSERVIESLLINEI